MRRTAFTLIEILVSLVITIMMMGAVVTLFGVMTDSVSGSRSLIEMTERLRATRNRLQTDLAGATATMKPPLRPENDQGYFELIEGPDSDLNYTTAVNLPLESIFGDADDVLMFTTRSTTGETFVGNFNGTTIESQSVEVMYFAVRNGPNVVLPTLALPRFTRSIVACSWSSQALAIKLCPRRFMTLTICRFASNKQGLAFS